MKWEQKVNFLILLSCFVLYLLTRWIRHLYLGEGLVFLRYHFTDMIAPIAMLSYCSFILNIRNRHSIRRIDQILVICTICSFLWEYCAPIIFEGSTADWIDVLSILCGGIVYWAIINLAISMEE